MKWSKWIEEKLNLLKSGRVCKFWQSSHVQTMVTVGSTPTPPTKYPTVNPRYPIPPSEKYTYLDYGTMTRDQLEPIVYKALQKRGWMFDFPSLEFYHTSSHEILPDMSQLYRVQDKLLSNSMYSIKGFYVEYLTLLDKGKEEEAHRHLQKMMNKQTVGMMYELYMQLIQTPMSRIKRTKHE